MCRISVKTVLKIVYVYSFLITRRNSNSQDSFPLFLNVSHLIVLQNFHQDRSCLGRRFLYIHIQSVSERKKKILEKGK